MGGKQMHHEQIKAEAGEHGLDDDLPRREPVQVLAAVQHQLQGADAGGQYRETQPVEPPAGRPSNSRG